MTPRAAAARRRAAREGAVFRALADPTRRGIVAGLAGRDRTVREIADDFPRVSRPAVSKHLAVLRRAGLVVERKDGRHRRYALEPGPLRDVVAYLAAVDAYWAERLEALGRRLDEP